MGRLSDQDESLFISLGAIFGVYVAITLLFCYLRERVPRFYLARGQWYGNIFTPYDPTANLSRSNSGYATGNT